MLPRSLEDSRERWQAGLSRQEVADLLILPLEPGTHPIVPGGEGRARCEPGVWPPCRPAEAVGRDSLDITYKLKKRISIAEPHQSRWMIQKLEHVVVVPAEPLVLGRLASKVEDPM